MSKIIGIDLGTTNSCVYVMATLSRLSVSEEEQTLFARQMGDILAYMLGAYVLSSGYYDAYYRKAAQVRRLIRDEYLAALDKCDALWAPVSPVTAWPALPLKIARNALITVFSWCRWPSSVCISTAKATNPLWNRATKRP